MATSGGLLTSGAAVFPDYAGNGSPEGVVTAAIGKSYEDTTNGAIWFKKTGAGNTGWVNAGGSTGVYTAPGANGVTIHPGAVITVPTDSHTATVAFGSLAVDTPKQNALGYDAMITGIIKVNTATAGTLAMGVGATATPTTDPLLGAFTTAIVVPISFAAVVPSGYYLSFVSGGTIVLGAVTAIVTPL